MLKLTPDEKRVLDRAIERSEDPETWTTGSLAEDSDGWYVSPQYETAVKFCLVGHINRAYLEVLGSIPLNGTTDQYYLVPLVPALEGELGYSLWLFNDKDAVKAREFLIEQRDQAVVEDPSLS